METIEYCIYPQNTHANAKLWQKAGIKLGKKEVVNFKPMKSWSVTDNPAATFYRGKQVYHLEFLKDKIEVTTYQWHTKKKNGDLYGMENYKETIIHDKPKSKSTSRCR